MGSLEMGNTVEKSAESSMFEAEIDETPTCSANESLSYPESSSGMDEPEGDIYPSDEVAQNLLDDMEWIILAIAAGERFDW